MILSGKSLAMSSAMALTKWRSGPHSLPSFSARALQFGHWQGLCQSFCETEKMVAVGVSFIQRRTAFLAISRTSGLVKHSWALPPTRFR